MLLERWRSISLRSQLVIVTSLLLTAGILVTSFVAISVLRESLLDRTDQEMAATVPSLGAPLWMSSRGQATTPPSHSGFLLDTDARVIVALQVERNTEIKPDLSRFTLDFVSENAYKAFTVESAGGNGPSWRVVAAPSSEYDVSVVAAEPLDEIESVVAAVTLLTLCFGIAILLAAIAVSWVAVNKAFTPLHRIESTAAQFAKGDLTQRIDDYSPQTELGQLSESLNTMLGHIEDSFEARKQSEAKLRRFVADASHELRTPLVSIRGYSELYRHGALQNEEDVSKAMDRIESESQRMTRLVEDLLMLARIDERRPSETADVDLLHLAYDAAGDAHASSPTRKIRVVAREGDSAPAPTWVHGDESRLRQVVANLMANALRYTPERSPIEIVVGPDRSDSGRPVAVLEIRDHGPGISGEDAERVFERFYRADSSRTRETGGTGLGLSIVSAIVRQHQGTVDLLETEGGGATMSVRLPLADRTAEEETPEEDED